ncbi:hypothetical protein DPV78_012189 [Talaromyces pinophilus]|nr:hypothetical protein DPV78_012189 [Talaromyces pinophilus]
MSEQEVLDQRLGVTNSDSVQSHGDSDDEPMVHETRKDYGPSARAWRDQLIATALILSLSSSKAPYAIKCHDKKASPLPTLKSVASTFVMAGGRRFDLGPGSGVTKREFREFREWCAEVVKAGEKVHEVPERWLKYEKQAEGRVGS